MNDYIKRQDVLDLCESKDPNYEVRHFKEDVECIPPMNLVKNSEWIDFLTDQFNISRTSARDMLHVMMSVKREDNFKKSSLAAESEE